MKSEIKKEITYPPHVTVEIRGAIIIVRGPQGEVQRDFTYPGVVIALTTGVIALSTVRGTKREKKIIGSFSSHLKNMIKGVQDPHVYKLKICSGHFPMSVTVSGQELAVKNFLGESVPRKISFPRGVTININGTEIVVQSPDKELAGQTAAKIERLCHIRDHDMRVFQDGCYLVHKAGKEVA